MSSARIWALCDLSFHFLFLFKLICHQFRGLSKATLRLVLCARALQPVLSEEKLMGMPETREGGRVSWVSKLSQEGLSCSAGGSQRERGIILVQKAAGLDMVKRRQCRGCKVIAELLCQSIFDCVLFRNGASSKYILYTHSEKLRFQIQRSTHAVWGSGKGSCSASGL